MALAILLVAVLPATGGGTCVKGAMGGGAVRVVVTGVAEVAKETAWGRGIVKVAAAWDGAKMAGVLPWTAPVALEQGVRLTSTINR